MATTTEVQAGSSGRRQKKGVLPRLPDPPHPQRGGIMETVGEIKENARGFGLGDSCRGDGGVEIMWLVGSSRVEEWSPSIVFESCRAWILISGLSINLWSEGSFRNIVGIDEVMELTTQGQVYSIVAQEANLVRVSAVENMGMVPCVESDGKSQEGSVGSSCSHMSGETVRVVSPCWRVNQLWRLEHSAGCQHAAPTEQIPREVVVGLDSNTLDKLEDTQKRVPVDAGATSACLAPVLGTFQGSDWKFKSVNTLVESLSSP
ncbi:hypothetical protein V6N11_001509 [Hibiscus sabdariffa]|uniref:DUF4283 domain-containing protein n=1 Tax=Hibiscus sabdariffa TaxID=183260 RepID=A0ABR2S003_9ROSI